MRRQARDEVKKLGAGLLRFLKGCRPPIRLVLATQGSKSLINDPITSCQELIKASPCALDGQAEMVANFLTFRSRLVG